MKVTPEELRAIAEERERKDGSNSNGDAPEHDHAGDRHYEFQTYAEFATREFPDAKPLLGERGALLLGVGTLLMVYGADGSGKSTWTIDAVVHLAAGVDWLGFPVPRPVRICVIENEGPPSLFQQKLADKIASWDGPDPTPNLFVLSGPWGEFSFADANGRAALREYCDAHQVDLVTANPTLGLGVGASGKPNETQQFVDWLVECGLKSTRAFWMLHHQNKAGQISGDWGRHPDTKVLLGQDGNLPRTKCEWAKTRWMTPRPKPMMLDWVPETQAYTVTEIDTRKVSDAELDERIAEYLTRHPRTSTTVVRNRVEGSSDQIGKRLKEGPFDGIPGPRNATLWSNRSERVSDPSFDQTDETDGWSENPYE